MRPRPRLKKYFSQQQSLASKYQYFQVCTPSKDRDDFGLFLHLTMIRGNVKPNADANASIMDPSAPLGIVQKYASKVHFQR